MTIGAAKITIERHAEIVGCSVCHCERDSQDGIRAKLALGCGAVQLDHGLVDSPLIHSRHSDDFRSYLFVDVLHCFQHSLSAITLRVAITKLESLVLASRSTRWNRSHSDCAIFKFNFTFDCRISP